MKGIVFTEFLEMVESAFGPDVADRMIVQANTPSGGVFTSVGTYDHAELVAMVVRLSVLTGTPADALVRAFGEHLFGRFAALFPKFFVGVTSPFDFLAAVESYIHPEVRKLYPDAMLPRFEPVRHSADRMDLIYRSSRPFADLAEGLIRGCAAHFRQPLDLRREPMSDGPAGGQAIRFVLTRAAEATLDPIGEARAA
jgi:hypothetical protein